MTEWSVLIHAVLILFLVVRMGRMITTVERLKAKVEFLERRGKYAYERRH